jgi:hypothetical protein
MGFISGAIGAVGGTGGPTRRPNAFLAVRVGGLWPGEVAGPSLKVSPPGVAGEVKGAGPLRGPSNLDP